MAGWEQQLDELVRERRGALVGYACLFARDRRDAEDLVHEALVRTFSRPRTFTSAGAAEAYVRQAVRTSFLDQVRKQRTWSDRAHLFAAPDSSRGPEQAVGAGVDVRAALGALSPRERACVVLRHFDDMPVAEIAQVLGISSGAVKRYLSDATATLRTLLGADVAEPVERATITPLSGRGGR